jgi:hypothetical protein
MSGSTGNKIVAGLIVLIFLLAFLSWALMTTSMFLEGDASSATALFIPGALFFGVLGLGVRQLWGCSNPVFE